MSASKQAKSKKVGKVMREFKSGTLKSGGSDKKVTNPKQAIAIALSEANRMNQGGMMYNEVMNRPMFQTPQMRQGGGIMAGVAPIRGYEEGGFADSLAEEIRGFGDFLRNPEDSISPELYAQLAALSDEEAITLAEAGGLGATALIALMKLHPALRRLKGFKPKAKMTEADLAVPKPGPRVAGERDIMGTNVISKGPGTRRVKQGERFDPRASRTEAQSSKPSTTGQSAKPKPESKKADAPKADAPKGEEKSLGQRVAGNLRKGVGIGALAGSSAYLSQMPFYQDLVKRGLISLDDLTGASDLYEEYMPESIKDIISPDVGERVELIESAKARLPEVATARKEGFPEQPKDPPPPPPDPTFLDMLKGAGSRALKSLQDPATRYALAKAAQPTEGFVPRDFFSDFALGKEEYRQLEAQREPDDTALMRNYQFLRETTDLNDNDIISLLSNQASPRDEFISLFAEQTKASGGSITPEQIAKIEAATGYTLPEEARVRLGVAASPSADVD
jgi:hypothetical protein